MKNKAPLILIEQTVMVLVFALAAALCLQAFVWADRTSRHNADRDAAVLHARSAAEVLKSQHGSFTSAADFYGGIADGPSWEISYDENWNKTDSEPAFRLRVLPTEDTHAYLGSASVEVVTADGKTLAALPVCWQEVTPNG